MRVQVVIQLEVTCVALDGAEVPFRAEGEKARAEIMQAVGAGVASALRRAPLTVRDSPHTHNVIVEIQGAGDPYVPPRPDFRPQDAVDVLRELVNDIEVTGGLVRDERDEWLLVPAGDPEWVDLAVTYEHACVALGSAPKVATEDDEGETPEGGEDESPLHD